MLIPRQEATSKIPNLKVIAQGMGFSLSTAMAILIDAKDREKVQNLLENVNHVMIQL